MSDKALSTYRKDTLYESTSHELNNSAALSNKFPFSAEEETSAGGTAGATAEEPAAGIMAE